MTITGNSIKHITFLNIHQLERQDTDIQTKVEELEKLSRPIINTT